MQDRINSHRSRSDNEVRFFSFLFQRIRFLSYSRRARKTLIQSRGSCQRVSFFSRIFKHPRAELILKAQTIRCILRRTLDGNRSSLYCRSVVVDAFVSLFFGRQRQMRGTWHRRLRFGNAKFDMKHAPRCNLCESTPEINSFFQKNL